MLLLDLDDELDIIADRDDFWSPEVYIRIGGYMVPLKSVKYIPEDDNHEEAVILQAEDYDDDLM